MVPEVYMMVAGSSGLGGTGSAVLPLPSPRKDSQSWTSMPCSSGHGSTFIGLTSAYTLLSAHRAGRAAVKRVPLPSMSRANCLPACAPSLVACRAYTDTSEPSSAGTRFLEGWTAQSQYEDSVKAIHTGGAKVF